MIRNIRKGIFIGTQNAMPVLLEQFMPSSQITNSISIGKFGEGKAFRIK